MMGTPTKGAPNFGKPPLVRPRGKRKMTGPFSTRAWWWRPLRSLWQPPFESEPSFSLGHNEPYSLSPLNWVAVKELSLSYYIGEAILITIYTHYGKLKFPNSNPVNCAYGLTASGSSFAMPCSRTQTMA